jgi:glycerophosphoryl diester phosphodiesterase
MKIVSHKGAAGLALENTKESIEHALAYNIDGIEFDVRHTLDGYPVLVHDLNTEHISLTKVEIKKTKLKDLQKITLKNGERIIQLEEALDIIDNRITVYIDIKDPATVRSLIKIIDKYPDTKFILTGRIHEFIHAIAGQRPGVGFLVQSHFGPFEIIQTARRLGAVGVSLNAWLMNPLTYYLSKRYNLVLFLYTVNNPLVGWFIRKFYPQAIIVTDYPQRFTNKLQ